MITARLTDHIWSTRKAESLNGLKLMQAEIIGGGTDTGKKIIVVDIISAGIGDRVVVTTVLLPEECWAMTICRSMPS